jgi:hypothetical protein
LFRVFHEGRLHVRFSFHSLAGRIPVERRLTNQRSGSVKGGKRNSHPRPRASNRGKGVSRPLHSLNVAKQHLKGSVSFPKQHHKNDFTCAVATAKELAEDLDISPCLQAETKNFLKCLFDYESRKRMSMNATETFRTDCFQRVVDRTLQSMQTRCDQYQEHCNRN